jgi:hypothetical protein
MWKMLMSVHKASLDMPWYTTKTLYSAFTGTSLSAKGKPDVLTPLAMHIYASPVLQLRHQASVMVDRATPC